MKSSYKGSGADKLYLPDGYLSLPLSDICEAVAGKSVRLNFYTEKIGFVRSDSTFFQN